MLARQNPGYVQDNSGQFHSCLSESYAEQWHSLSLNQTHCWYVRYKFKRLSEDDLTETLSNTKQWKNLKESCFFLFPGTEMRAFHIHQMPEVDQQKRFLGAPFSDTRVAGKLCFLLGVAPGSHWQRPFSLCDSKLNSLLVCLNNVSQTLAVCC